MSFHLVDGTYELFRSSLRRASSAGRQRARGRRDRRLAAQPLAAALDARRDARRLRLRPRRRVVPQRAVRRLQVERRRRPGPAGAVRARRAAARALGLVVWPMVEFEADDALAAAAARFRDAPGVDQVVLCSPDKDLAQPSSGSALGPPPSWTPACREVRRRAATLLARSRRPSAAPRTTPCSSACSSTSGDDRAAGATARSTRPGESVPFGGSARRPATAWRRGSGRPADGVARGSRAPGTTCR